MAHSISRALIEKLHYAKGCSHTSVYSHGLFLLDSDECMGAALWMPPTNRAAQATYPKDWRKVLCLSRLVIHPDCPTNAASFLLGRSEKLIDRDRWECLVTYADEWQGHTGTIYKATNWEYKGLTRPTQCWVIDGRMVARKSTRTRTKQEMLDLGATVVGSFSKHKYVKVISR